MEESVHLRSHYQSSRRGRLSRWAGALTLALGLTACGLFPSPDGAMTLRDALRTRPDDVITVRGYVVHDGTMTRLCAELLESYPPQCGAPFVALAGLALNTVEGLAWSDGGMAWTSRPVDIRGRLDGETLRVVP